MTLPVSLFVFPEQPVVRSKAIVSKAAASFFIVFLLSPRCRISLILIWSFAFLILPDLVQFGN